MVWCVCESVVGRRDGTNITQPGHGAYRPSAAVYIDSFKQLCFAPVHLRCNKTTSCASEQLNLGPILGRYCAGDAL